MKDGRKARESIWYEAMLLATVVAISYFLFQLLLIFSAVSLDGCLYEFWAPEGWSIFSIQGAFAVLVSALIVWVAMWFKRCLAAEPQVPWYAVATFFGVAIVVLGLWARALFHMHRAFQYERGLLPASQWFSEHQLFMLQEFGSGVCNAA